MLEQGYKYFSLVDIKINKIEWLYLHRHGHRRALFKVSNCEIVNKQYAGVETK